VCVCVCVDEWVSLGCEESVSVGVWWSMGVDFLKLVTFSLCVCELKIYTHTHIHARTHTHTHTHTHTQATHTHIHRTLVSLYLQRAPDFISCSSCGVTHADEHDRDGEVHLAMVTTQHTYTAVLCESYA